MSIPVCRLVLIGVMALGVVDAQAQNRGNANVSQQNQQGGFGQGTQSGFGATGQGQSSLSGQGQSGRGGVGQQGLAGQQQNARQQQGGRQDAFIGSDAEQIRNQLRNQNPGQRRRAVFDFAIESLNEQRESRRQQRSQRNASPLVRVQLRPLFTVTQPSSAELTTRVRSQLSRALPESVAAAPQVSVSQGTATLRGQVKNDYDRQLMAKMVSLQPGISQVENQLTIEPGQGQPELVAPSRQE